MTELKNMGIDNQYVSFTIIQQNGNGLIYGRAALLLIILLFVLIFIPDQYLASQEMSIAMLVIFFLLIAIGIKSSRVKRHDEIGKIVFLPTSIQITENNTLLEIPIVELGILKFDFSGYKNQPVFGRTGASKDGLNNFITIKNQNYGRRFELFITNEYQLNILNRLLDHYNELGIKNGFKDSYSSDAKTNLIRKLLQAFNFSNW